MRKNRKVILSIAITIIALITLLAVLKTRTIKTNIEEDNSLKELLETKYEKLGSYDVDYIEYESNTSKVKKYSIWYPKKLEISDEKYPTIVIANGTGATAESHKDVISHLITREED